jgi:hypothetical protein
MDKDIDLEILDKLFDENVVKNLLSNVTGKLEQETAEVAVKASEGVNLDWRIRDRIYGLLEKDKLTMPEIALLSALMQSVLVEI